jgi:recombination protein RecA
MSDDVRRFLANARPRGAAVAAKVVSLEELIQSPRSTEVWGMEALRGRLVELSARGASATLSAAFDLVLEAQRAAEPVAWITLAAASFYPPDAADAGIDLSALVVVRACDATAAARAAERLLRSGAFGLIVIDLGALANVEIGMPLQGRLVTLAQTHDAAVVCVTEKSPDTPSLGSLVSLRAQALRARGPHGFELEVRALKDKRRGPGWSRVRKARGPSGL